MSDKGKNAAYLEGYRAEAARLAAREAAREAPRAGGYAADAEDVMRHLRHDDAVKNRILARSPALYAIDAEELGPMSASELATRELKELGITPQNSDPVELLDAHHAGRDYARKSGAQDGVRRSFSGARTDGMDSMGDTFIDKYTRGE